ncbi:MAG: hypothetical protein WDW38_006101 [Sanguina aurantia]
MPRHTPDPGSGDLQEQLSKERPVLTHIYVLTSLVTQHTSPSEPPRSCRPQAPSLTLAATHSSHGAPAKGSRRLAQAGSASGCAQTGAHLGGCDAGCGEDLRDSAQEHALRTHTPEAGHRAADELPFTTGLRDHLPAAYQWDTPSDTTLLCTVPSWPPPPAAAPKGRNMCTHSRSHTSNTQTVPCLLLAGASEPGPSLAPDPPPEPLTTASTLDQSAILDSNNSDILRPFPSATGPADSYTMFNRPPQRSPHRTLHLSSPSRHTPDIDPPAFFDAFRLRLGLPRAGKLNRQTPSSGCGSSGGGGGAMRVSRGSGGPGTPTRGRKRFTIGAGDDGALTGPAIPSGLVASPSWVRNALAAVARSFSHASSTHTSLSGTASARCEGDGRDAGAWPVTRRVRCSVARRSCASVMMGCSSFQEQNPGAAPPQSNLHQDPASPGSRFQQNPLAGPPIRGEGSEGFGSPIAPPAFYNTTGSGRGILAGPSGRCRLHARSELPGASAVVVFTAEGRAPVSRGLLAGDTDEACSGTYVQLHRSPTRLRSRIRPNNPCRTSYDGGCHPRLPDPTPQPMIRPRFTRSQDGRGPTHHREEAGGSPCMVPGTTRGAGTLAAARRLCGVKSQPERVESQTHAHGGRWSPTRSSRGGGSRVVGGGGGAGGGAGLNFRPHSSQRAVLHEQGGSSLGAGRLWLSGDLGSGDSLNMGQSRAGASMGLACDSQALSPNEGTSIRTEDDSAESLPVLLPVNTIISSHQAQLLRLAQPSRADSPLQTLHSVEPSPRNTTAITEGVNSSTITEGVNSSTTDAVNSTITEGVNSSTHPAHTASPLTQQVGMTPHHQPPSQTHTSGPVSPAATGPATHHRSQQASSDDHPLAELSPPLTAAATAPAVLTQPGQAPTHSDHAGLLPSPHSQSCCCSSTAAAAATPSSPRSSPGCTQAVSSSSAQASPGVTPAPIASSIARLQQQPPTLSLRPPLTITIDDGDMPPLTLGGGSGSIDPGSGSGTRSTRTDLDSLTGSTNCPLFAISASMVYVGGGGGDSPGPGSESGTGGLLVMGRSDSGLSTSDAEDVQLVRGGGGGIVNSVGGVGGLTSAARHRHRPRPDRSSCSADGKQGGQHSGGLGSGVFLGRQGRELPQQQLHNLQFLYPAGNPTPYDTPVAAASAAARGAARRLAALCRQQQYQQLLQRHGGANAGSGSFVSGSGSSGGTLASASSAGASLDGSLTGHVNASSRRSTPTLSRATTWGHEGRDLSSSTPDHHHHHHHHSHHHSHHQTQLQLQQQQQQQQRQQQALPVQEAGSSSSDAAKAAALEDVIPGTWRAASPPPVPVTAITPPSTPAGSYTQTPGSGYVAGAGLGIRLRGLSRLGSHAPRSVASSLSGSELFGA